mmetsp:Transcript_9899/g.17474  ORF Transcript_9899/g.17474 Transcript_9899/m.17474 type:complete len:236 (-) Transcript_9899:504-1211(-)
MNTMPESAAAFSASTCRAFSSTMPSSSASSSKGRASLMVIFRRVFLVGPALNTIMRCTMSDMPGSMPMGGPGCSCGTSTSILWLSSSPRRTRSSQSWWSCSAAPPPPPPPPAVPPTSRSTTCCSALARAAARSSCRLRCLVMTTAASARSRTIWSTSRPWNPTSVNLVASTFTKGALQSFAIRRAISVLPQPVGPIIKMFLGTTSFRRSLVSCWRRHLFLRAIAIALLALAWPTI